LRRSRDCVQVFLAAVVIVALVSDATSLCRGSSLRKFERERALRDGPIVEDVRFIGVEAFDESTLLEYMAIHPSGFMEQVRFDPGVLEQDLVNLALFYNTRGYLEADLWVEDTALSAESTRITILISVHEGDGWIISDVTLHGNVDIAEDYLRSLLAVTEATPLLSNGLARDRRAILNHYARLSYLDAHVEQTVTRDDVARTASVSYDIVEGERVRISGIRIHGDDKTRKFVIERELTFEEGEYFDVDKIGESQAKLYRTGLFNSVWMEPAREETGTSERGLDIRVNERRSVSLDLSVGYATIDGPEATALLVNRNVQGQATRLEFHGYLSRLQRAAGASAGDPWFLGLPVAGELSIDYLWSDEEAYIAEMERAAFFLTRKIGSALTLRSGYEFQRNMVFEATDEDSDLGTNYTTDLLVAATHDTRDDVLDPERGMLTGVEFGLASSLLGGTNDFTRTEFIWRGYKKVWRHRIVALAGHVGWIRPQENDDVPVNERFFAGGDGSVRGFDRNSLGPAGEDGEATGGLGLLELRAEARFPLFRRLRMVAILDAGQVFDDFRAIRPSDLAIGAGGGLRYHAGLWIVRLDVVAPVTEPGPTRFYFGIGQAF
jgi:outer membrane protein assembly complex protein YaeT